MADDKLNNKRPTFDQVLSALGHVYFRSEDDVDEPVADRIRHIPKTISETGEIVSLCGDGQPVDGNNSWIQSPGLWLDVNCVECRKRQGIDFRAVTKRSLLLDCVHILMNIEQQFLDAIYWNAFERGPGEEKHNPDPDGFLAESWEQSADQVTEMIERCRLTMAKHAGRFGWPDEITDGKTKTDRDRDLRKAPDHP